jgi:hypothetical protein
MMKSPTILQGYIKAMFQDVAAIYSKTNEVERDMSRLLHEVQFRGLEVLAVELPSLCKHFDKCLGLELYTRSGLPLSRSAKKGVVLPVFLQDLYLQVFTPEGMLRVQPSITAIIALRQILKGLSKVDQQCRKDRISNEVANFRAIEDDLPDYTLPWGGVWPDYDSISYRCHRISFVDDSRRIDERVQDRPLPSGSSIRHDSAGPADPRGPLATLQRVADVASASLGDFSFEISDGGRIFIPKHGKGRVSNLSRAVSKYRFQEWPEKLDCIFPFELYGSPTLGQRPYERELPGVCGSTSPSKLIAVPKTLKGPRLIASEPNQQMWIQQLVSLQLRSKIDEKSSVFKECIRIDDQTRNARMALEASRSGTHATIDLSSASDRLSLWTIERLFRRNLSFLTRLNACRTPTIRNGIDKSWDLINLKKAFSQGNALTFPTQSVAYAIIVASAVIYDRGLQPSAKVLKQVLSECSVYGDDIIVPVDHFESSVYLLEALGLKVNLDKTFHKGRFRESCGVDAYDGVDVTPAYVKTLLQKPNHEKAVATIQASNNLHMRLWWNLAAWQSSLVSHLSGGIPVCYHKDSKLGFWSFSGNSTRHLRSRWNPRLHREEFSLFQLHSKAVRADHDLGYDHLFQWFVERPSPEKHWSSGFDESSSAVMRRDWNALYGVDEMPEKYVKLTYECSPRG